MISHLPCLNSKGRSSFAQERSSFVPLAKAEVPSMMPTCSSEQPCCSNVGASALTARRTRTHWSRRTVPCIVSYAGDKPSQLIGRTGRFDLNTAVSTAADISPRGPGLARPPLRDVRHKLRVAVDVDEVLGRFLHSLNQFCLDAYGQSYSIQDYHEYNFARVWRCSQDESNRRVHEFFTSHHFAAGIEAMPGAAPALARLREDCFDLVVVTSRQHVIEAPTLEWIARHFPGTFSSVHFGNHWALEGSSRKKSDICTSLGAHVLIDDNPQYALECAAAGIRVLLYDWDHGYPWASTPEGPSHDLITRVKDWEEVEVVLGVLAAAAAAEPL